MGLQVIQQVLVADLRFGDAVIARGEVLLVFRQQLANGQLPIVVGVKELEGAQAILAASINVEVP